MTALLVIIYLAFIGLGLPDALLGSAWPAMQQELGASLGLVGVIAMVVTIGTVVASLYSNKLISRYGTGFVTTVSVTLTAVALVGISFAPSVWFIFAMAVPLGLGAGSVDAALNNFVALHYEAKHMSWLHCFWGVGATAGPVIMSMFLGAQGGWKNGYLTIGIIQCCLVAVLLLSSSKWKLVGESKGERQSNTDGKVMSNREAFGLPYIKLALVSFVLYCGIELMAGLWSSSYFAGVKGLSAVDAARCASVFYGSITIGRFVSGFLTMRLGNRQIIRLGESLCVAGAVLMLLPIQGSAVAITGLVLIGLGAAPIYPCMLHETPNRFGKEASQAVMGLQMAFAYVGSSLLPPLLGAAANTIGIGILPISLVVCTVAMLAASELLENKLQKNRESAT